MSLVDGIGNAVGSLGRLTQPQAQAPGGDASAGLQRRFAPAFRTTFNMRISTVLEQAAHGAWDDPDIAARIKELQQRLRARGQAGAGRTGTPVTAGSRPDPATGGAHAGPAIDGGGGGDLDLTPQSRQLLALRAQQAAARLGAVSSSLRGRFSNWADNPRIAHADIETFRPSSEAEARAFAERLAVELTEGAARLEKVSSELELARFDSADGGPQAAARVAQLEAEHAQVEAQVLAIARKVDEEAGDVVGRQPAAANPSVEVVVEEAVRNGIDSDDIATLKKAVALAQDEARTGNSALVNEVQRQLREQLVMDFIREQDKRDRRRHEEEQQAYERRRQDERAYEQRLQQRALDQASAQRSAEQARQLRAWLDRPSR